MKMTKRLMALALLAALLLSLLAGCSQTPVSKDPDKENAPSATFPEVVLDPLTEEEQLQSLPSRAPGGSALEYTILLYLVGSDLESNSGCASKDMEEIRKSGLDTSRVNFLVYTGGARYWQNEVPSDCNVVYELTPGGWNAVAATATPSSMGDPSTFLDFMNYAYSNYPAEHYGLICWDHGAGPLAGYGFDEVFGNDRLYLPEMETALEASPFAKKKLDFLGFDACLMATMEVAEMASSYAHYLIASEETEPGIGWDYSFLNTLNSTSDFFSIVASILVSYEFSMDIYKVPPEYTLSCIDLSQLKNFRKSADKLFSKMADGVKDGSYSAIAQIRQQTLRFAPKAKSPYDLVDMGDLAKRLSSLYPNETAAFQTALNQLVISQVTNLEGATGLAVYFPYDNKELYTNLGQPLYTQLTDCDGYEDFIAAFSDYWINGEPAANFSEHEVAQPEVVTPSLPASPTQPTAAPQTPPAEGAAIELSSQQLANLSSVTYTVFAADIDQSSGQKVYIPVLSEIPLTPDSAGAVYLPDNQQLILLRTDEEEEGILWPATRVSSAGGVHYISDNAYLTATTDTVSGTEHISLYFSEGSDSSLRILSMTTMDNAEALGRAEPELSHWEYIANRYTTLFPTCNNAGNLTAYTSWDDSGDEYYTMLAYDREFWLEQVPMAALEGEFYYQILLKDTQGNTYASALTLYADNTRWEEYSENSITYHLYADRAKVAGYTGAGGELTIPASVKGKPVTEIGEEAFYYNRDITYVVLPESLDTVGARAFAGCRNLTGVLFRGAVKTLRSEAFSRSGLTSLFLPEGIERIEYSAFAHTPLVSANIPASVAYMGSGVFAHCQELIGFTVALDPNGSSPYFKAVNGILLTADGKELVQAPLGGSTRLTIPDSVQIIRSSAVRGSETLLEVSFPAGLKEIGSFAFYDTLGLQSLQLPDSLEIIGNSAFGQFGVSVNTASPVTSVTIGPNVRHIGYDAFDGYPIGRFEVSSQNRHYSANGGHLLNKSGTVFLHAAYTYTGVLGIPEGVNHLAFHCLNLCDGITSLVLSDTVVSMDRHTGLPDAMTNLSVGKALSRWDNIADAYYLENVSVSEINPYFMMYNNCIYSRNFSTLYACLNQDPVLTIPEGVTTLTDTAFAPDTGYNKTLTELHLPSTILYLSGEMFRNLPALERVEIAEGNASYASHEGLIYTKNGVSLILCPQAKTGTVSVKIGTATIWRYAFYGQLQASRIVIPEGVMTIRKGNFVTYRPEVLDLQLPGTLEKIYPDMLRSPDGYSITCPKGSDADIFARSRGAEVRNK